jgi:hypothetical protein
MKEQLSMVVPRYQARASTCKKISSWIIRGKDDKANTSKFRAGEGEFALKMQPRTLTESGIVDLDPGKKQRRAL